MIRIIAWICLLFVCGVCPVSADESIVIDDSFVEGSLALSSTRIMATDESDFETVKKLFAKGWAAHGQSHRIPGHAKSVWIYAKIDNRISRKVFLEFIYPLLDAITVYSYPVGDENHISTYRTGDSYPFANREYPAYDFIVPVETAAESHIFIHVQSAGQLNPNFKIWLSTDGIFRTHLWHYLFFGAYFGIMIAMIFYNVFLFINIREITYLYYVLYITAFFFSTLTYYGFSSLLIFRHNTYWPQVLINVFFPATGIFFIQFSRHYLNTREFTPKLDTVLKIFTGILSIPLFLFYIPALYTALNYLLAFMAVVTPSTIFIITVYLLFRIKYRPAVYYFIAICSLGVAFSLCALGWWLQLQETMIFSYILPVSSAMDVILFSIGLSDKINTYRKEKEQIQDDIIELQKRSYLEIEEKNNELKRLDAIKDEFLANTTHEIKTPLHAMIGIVDSLLDNGGLPEDYRHYNLHLVRESAKRLSLILNDILDYSKMKVSQIRLHCEPVNLKEVSGHVVDMSRFLVKNKSITITNRINGDLPLAFADKNRIQQVIHNLMQNAIAYTQEGMIEVSAVATGDTIAFAIADTGIGIDDQHIDRIFESFEQAGDQGGTGLGLSITKNLITLHGGQLWVEKNKPHGSVFTFTLPVAPRQDHPVETHSPGDFNTHTPAISVENQFVSTGIPTILAVDDETLNLYVLSSIFKEESYNVIYCHSGQEALEIIKDQKPDILLLDIMMPKMDGYQVAAAVRKIYSPVDVPIIFLSVKNQEQDVVNGFSMGGNDYVAKPFSKRELLARIENLLFIKHLATNSDLLHDLYILSSNNFLYINTENRIPYLYTSLSDTNKRKQLLSPLSTLKTFCGEEKLLQINRSCMINPAKVTNVIKHKVGNNVKYQIEIGGLLSFPLTQTHLPGVKSIFPDFFNPC